MAVVTQLEALQQLLFVYRTALVPDAIKQPYDNWIDDADAARRNLLATGYVLPDAWLNLAKQSPLPKWWASRFPVTHSRYPDPEQVQAVCTEIEAEIKRLEFSPLPVSENETDKPLDKCDVAVLCCLNNRKPQLLHLVDIATTTESDQETVGKAVNKLIAYKYVHRPEGERKGATVTTEGSNVAKKFSKPTLSPH